VKGPRIADPHVRARGVFGVKVQGLGCRMQGLGSRIVALRAQASRFGL